MNYPKLLSVALLILVVSFSCKKDEDETPVFRYLDIEDAFGLVLGKYVSGTDTALKLFKLNAANNLEKVRFLNDGKGEMQLNKIPQAMYHLSATYFAVTFLNEKKVSETYLIRRFDGKALRLAKPVQPELAGKPDLNVHAIRSDFYSGFFFTDSKGNWKLNLQNINAPVTEEILKGEKLGKDFIVDYMGNILTAEKLFHVYGNASIPENAAGTHPVYPLKSFVNNMYYVFRKGDSVQCSKIDVSSPAVSEKKLLPSVYSPEYEFVNSHTFPKVNKIAAVLSGAIMVIDGSSVKKADLLPLNLRRIIRSEASEEFCYIYGDNPVNQKVLVRVDLKQSTPVFTQILAPGEVEILHYMVAHDNRVMFTGIRNADNRRLFGYIPASGSNRILDHDGNIEAIQVMVR